MNARNEPVRESGFDRLPPHSIEAEMCLIAAMMLDRDFALDAMRMVDSESFYLPDHKIIFQAIADLVNLSKPVDAVILRDELRRMDLLDRIGGSAYIANILASIPSAAHGAEYAQRVRESAMLRKIITLSDDAIRRAFDRAESATSIIGSIQGELTKLITASATDHVQTLGSMLAQAVREIREPLSRDFVSYGFKSLDAKLIGIMPGEFVVVAARPSMGKSTLLRQMAVQGAMDGTPTLFISLEESPTKVGRNVLSWLASTENQRIRRGDVRSHELGIMDDCAAKMREVPFWFVWGVNKADAIRSLVMSYATKFGIKSVFLDYLQLVDAGGKTDFEKATAASRAVSEIPKTTGVRLISAAQLNRSVAGRDSHRPTMTDIRSSGQIEQDADAILLLHREDYYHIDDPNYQNTDEAEVIIAKARDSERGDTVPLRSCLAYQCFEDIGAPTSGQQQEFKHEPGSSF